jgi:uncharacterized membrane protein
MSSSPVLIFHISVGALALLAGAVSLVLRKGSQPHRLAGRVFVIAMVSMTTSAFYLAWRRGQIGVCLVATLTLYLVLTAWRTARRRDGRPGAFEFGALFLVLLVAAGLVWLGVEALNSPTGRKEGVTARRHLAFALVAYLSAVGDLRLLIRGGIVGAQRIARHLWRMAVPLLIAANTLFQGQARLFPAGLQRVHALYLPLVLIIGAATYWLIRLLFLPGKRWKPAALDWLRT